MVLNCHCKGPLVSSNVFKVISTELVVHNYENVKISKNGRIGGSSRKKGMSLRSIKRPRKCPQMFSALFGIGLNTL